MIGRAAAGTAAAAAPGRPAKVTPRARGNGRRRLRDAARAGVWWVLSIGLAVGVWEAAAALVLTGSLAFYFETVRKLTLPLVTLLAPIAPVAWIPLAIVAFGVGDWAAIFVVFVGIYFMLTLATVKAMTNVEPVYLDTARVLGARRWQMMLHVVLPATLPALFDLVRLNLFGAWMGVLAAEMVGVNTGLGAIVMVGRQMMNMNLTFLGMAMIGLVGYLLDAAFAQVQRRVLWWRRATEL